MYHLMEKRSRRRRPGLIALFLCVLALLCSACGEDELQGNQDVITICTWNVEDFKYSYVDISIENFIYDEDENDPNAKQFYTNIELTRTTLYYSNSAYARAAAFLKTNNVDIVCLQEMQPGNSLTETYGDGSISSPGDTIRFNIALLAWEHPMEYYGYSVDGGFRNDYVAYWSRFKLYDMTSVKPETMVDPGSGKVYGGYRPILRTRVNIRGRDIWFYGMHLKSNAGGVVEDNMGRRRAQAYHLARYIQRNHDPENDLIVILGDMNTMETDYDGSGNSTIDYLCLKYDNPYNTANDFVPVNLKHLGAVTNWSEPGNGGETPGTTHPGEWYSYPDATFDHIILSPALYHNHYVQGSVKIFNYYDKNSGVADHNPVLLQLSNF